ncbi:MAG: DUF1801 domain-containing protein [Phycisphaerales bacterium]|nr:DUF1801 domain-containing protein [Phycisphaerales bacterium]
MKSKASTVAAYLDSLPPDRREAIEAVRRVILDNLDRKGPDGKGKGEGGSGGGFVECMQYGVIGYCVPHSVWPHGHHTRPELPLMYMGLSSQKNDMVVYMLFLLHNKPEREWFDKAWKATGKKSHLEVGGMGCCLRFRKVEDLSLDVIGEAMRRMPVKKYLKDHVAALARMGKGPDGKPLKQGEGGTRARREGAKVKSATPTAGNAGATTRKSRSA